MVIILPQQIGDLLVVEMIIIVKTLILIFPQVREEIILGKKIES